MDPNIPVPISPIQPITPSLTPAPVVSTPMDRSFGKRFFGNRINRLQYITGVGICLGLNIFLALLLPPIFAGIGNLFGLSSTVSARILILVIPILIYPFSIFYSFSFTIRRLHDSDRSGWFWLLGLVPIVSLYLLYLTLILSGNDGDNKYGIKPPEKMPTKEIFGF